jgi:hypothetical protein
MKRTLHYVYVPIIDNYYNYDEGFYESIEEITDFTVEYAMLDALSLEYYGSIEFH